jgi:AraC-like DNA-binding protein
MGDPATLQVLNLSLRGGVVLLLLLVGAGLLRDQPKAAAARLGALFALGAAAYAICSTPGVHARAGLWAAPIVALAVGNNLVFWLFARALFDDGYRPRAAWILAWAGIAALGVVGALGLAPSASAQDAVGVALALQALGFAVLAVAQTLSSWRTDLVEPRRRIRVFIVAASALHIGLTAMAGLSPRLDFAPVVRLADAAALAAIALTVAWTVLRVSAAALLVAAPKAANRLEPGLDPADAALLRRLEREMTQERAYRQDGLTIGGLAHRLGTPEYRLRRAINQGLGQRNFAAYLNGYRIAEARAALADRSQDPVPILTIALDAGFGSLGPFNRAFKAETGMTPSEYRRASLGEGLQGLELGSAA